jgi:hypothetical protein
MYRFDLSTMLRRLFSIPGWKQKARLKSSQNAKASEIHGARIWRERVETDVVFCNDDRNQVHIICLVLSCLVLSCLVLSCLVLSCLVLSCLVLSCLSVCLYFAYQVLSMVWDGVNIDGTSMYIVLIKLENLAASERTKIANLLPWCIIPGST